MKSTGWSTKVMCPLLGKMTSFDPAIFSFISLESDGLHSSLSPAVIRTGTLIFEILSRIQLMSDCHQ